MKIFAKIIIFIAIFFIGFYTGQQYVPPALPDNEQPAAEQRDAEQITVSLMLDYGNGEIKTFNKVALPEKANSVFDLLQKIAADNGLELKSQDHGGDLGIFVEAINGQESDFANDQFWQYWVNNEYAKIGASNYYLADGDVVEWKYVKGQFGN